MVTLWYGMVWVWYGMVWHDMEDVCAGALWRPKRPGPNQDRDAITICHMAVADCVTAFKGV